MTNDAAESLLSPESTDSLTELVSRHDGGTELAPTVLEGEIVLDGEADVEKGHALPFAVVGMGGSAGSLEPFIEVFGKLHPRTGMAFVVVLHLLPNQESRLPEILQRNTTMNVMSIEDGTIPLPNHVYVLPPNVFVTLQGNRLVLEPRTTGPFLPINALFQSIAQSQKNFSIGIVLSGMDGDGAIGLRAIKGEGGFAIVQTPSSARHRSMPTSSIKNDHADMVLPPAEIAIQLTALARRFGDPLWLRFEEGETTEADAREFARILKLLRTVSGVDFRLYKPATIRRRIARRMAMHKIDLLSEYSVLLQVTGAELRQLQEDVLINVTRFFRDPEVFVALKTNVIPLIFAGREPDQPVRVWVAGCATGEEVYSIAMCLLEHLTGTSLEPNIQIFGTDASEDNVQRARLGIYAESIVNEVSPERVRRFFTKTEQGYQINKRIRDLCIFARQNLCTDPPFSRLDLVSCRNVLIYFGTELQRAVISTFHYALRRDGFLLLGSSESIREYTDLFSSMNRTLKLFSRTESHGHRSMIPSFAPLRLTEHPLNQLGPAENNLHNDINLSRLADRIILARYGPPGVMIDNQMEILQTRGKTSPYVMLAPGSASLKLPRMLHDSIAPDVVSAVSRAIQDGLPVQIDRLRFTDGEEVSELQLEVLPIPTGDSEGALYYLVSFLPAKTYTLNGSAPLALSSGHHLDANDLSLAQLRQDLASTKVYLNSLLDEREATNQELISANEEIQSSNEELQSTNEELETTKEELQSSNEELQTVNDELENRNSVLTQASNDLVNLLNSVNMAVLMLSRELHIRHFTPQTQRLMNVRPQDVGRPFSEIRLNLNVENIEKLLLEVLETLTPQEIEVQDRENRWYFLRIRPYRTTDDKIDGLVLVLVDIDQSRRSQQELRNARDFAASIISNTPLPLVVINADLQVVYMNDAFCGLTSLSRPTVEGRLITELASGLWNMGAPLGVLLENVLGNGIIDGSFECKYKQRDQTQCTLLVQAKRLQPDGQRFSLITFQDISAHKAVETMLKSEGERLATQVAQTTRELDRSREELRALTDNLMTSQEDERRHLARELHDDVSQRLALMDMDCQNVLEKLDGSPTEVREEVQHLRSRMAQISTDVRTLSHRLHPSILEHLGTAAALESLLDEFADREGVITSFFAEEFPVELPLELATGLYRIAQESLRNVAKHAGKAHVKLALHSVDGQVALDIADSGKGFDPAQHGTGLGLISMKERARLLGASLHIQSVLRRGTTVTVTMPMPVAQP